MRTKILLLILVAFILLGCSAKQNSPDAPASQVNNAQANPPVQASSTAQEAKPLINTIEITSTGFVPSTLTINKGEPVNFINKDLNTHWPASDPHPLHNGYPEQGGCIGSKFDACKPLANGEVWTFTFDIVGTWHYHDHLHPYLKGTIIVK